jgi:hypothetical protein
MHGLIFEINTSVQAGSTRSLLKRLTWVEFRSASRRELPWLRLKARHFPLICPGRGGLLGLPPPRSRPTEALASDLIRLCCSAWLSGAGSLSEGRPYVSVSIQSASSLFCLLTPFIGMSTYHRLHRLLHIYTHTGSWMAGRLEGAGRC